MMDRLNGCVFWMKMTKYNAIWHKVSAYIKKEFGSEPANKKYLKTKRKSNGDEVTDFYNKKFLM